jgi:Tol biopolymer transport system component
VLENVRAADWSHDGQLAVVREVGTRSRLEFPAGKVLYETPGMISHARISPDGSQVAFLEHPIPPDDTGQVKVVDRGGSARLLSPLYNSTLGLAWAPSGEEIWYTAAEVGMNSTLRAVTAHGTPKLRVVSSAPGRMILHDIARDGRVLFASEFQRDGCTGLFPGADTERDLSWLDLSLMTDLSADGKTALISEEGDGGGESYAVYLRKTDGAPAVRLGDGMALSLSPDGKWVLTTQRVAPEQLILLPTGAGEPRVLPRGPLETFHIMAGWFPDAQKVAFVANEKGRAARIYVQDVNGGLPRPFLPEGFRLPLGRPVSPDGKNIVVIDSAERPWLYPVDGGAGQPIPGLGAGDNPSGWSADGRFLYVYNRHGIPTVYRLEVSSGRKELWKQIRPADTAGFVPFFYVQVTPDGKSYAYTYSRILANLFLADGLH